jgi:hypothetical protein
MTTTLEYPRVQPQQPTQDKPGPASPMVGRRWSDGADSIAPVDPNAPWTMTQQWPNLVASLSEQAVESSNLMLRALNYLVGAGRLRRAEAKALGDAMHQLRATSLRAQQITRLAGGRIRHAKERVDLAELITHLLQERTAEFTAAGASVRGELPQVEVLLDPPVAISLLNSVVDWAMSFSKEVVLALEPPEWPGPARLVARVTTPPREPQGARREAGWSARPRGRRLNDGLHWMLLRQMAQSAGLEVRRTGEPGVAVLTIDFPKTFVSSEGVSCLELVESGPSSGALRDAWVLVVAQEDQLRTQALESLRNMGIDAVAAPSLEEARAAVSEGRPNVLVTGYDIDKDAIASFRAEVLGGEERCPLVEITRDVPSFHLSGFDRFETPKVGRQQLAAELPPTVLFELVKTN